MFHVEQLILHKKTGFKNLFPYRPVVIRDFRGIVFYSTIGLSPVEYFNLPEGKYFIDSGTIQILPKPNKKKILPLPTVERVMPSPENFSIVFAENPNKCTVDWAKKMITFDNSFITCELPVIYGMLYHEMGHQYYDTEKYCDLFACNMMLQKGYNESQCGKWPLLSLSHEQFERKEFIINQLTK
jgi:hypothetical protein